jgi:bifunctional non-homologous end joining protein LigD
MERQLVQRKESLSRLLARSGPAVLSDVVEEDGSALFEVAAERRLPGIVARSKSSRYHPGRTSNEWLEMPVFELENLVVGGYVLGLGKEEAVAGLLLGDIGPGNKLRFAGLVQGNIGAVPEAALAAFTTPACPFVSAPTLPRLVYWLKPEVVCQVKFARREADGRLRFPVFVTLRPDLAVSTLASAANRRHTAPAR